MSQGGRRETASATPSSSSSPGLASFSFSSLLPGSVSVSLDYPLWCWEAETITVEINPDLVPSVNIVQTGYAMLYTTSHDVTALVGKENETGVEYSLEKGSGRKCLAAPGLLVAVLVAGNSVSVCRSIFRHPTVVPQVPNETIWI
jgi:hypothetical protein